MNLTLGNNNFNYQVAHEIIQSFVDQGISQICLSPGYRNSPLILAAHNIAPQLCTTHFDERGSGFFALGCSKESRKPSLLIATSGTAVANFYPAVLEAYYSYTPLIVLTADRPNELINVGANQAMEQKSFFSEHTCFSINLDLNSSTNYSQFIQYHCAKALYFTNNGRKGPAHINVPFKEPLLVEDKYWSRKTQNFQFLSATSKDENFAENILSEISSSNFPVISVSNENFHETSLEKICKIAHQLDIPILAEAASGICSGTFVNECPQIIHNFESFPLNQEPLNKITTIIQFGGTLISKKIQQLLKQNPDIKIINIDHPDSGRNPSYNPCSYFLNEIEESIDLLWESISQKDLAQNQERTQLFQKAQNIWQGIIQSKLSQEEAITEPHISRAVFDSIPNKSNLIIGNSMPIRDLNYASLPTHKSIRIFSNRGLSGIDGLIAYAAAIAKSSQKKTTILLGDLSFQHDCNSLAYLKANPDINLKIIVLNNSGGEIFRLLPTQKFGEEKFTNPQDCNFKSIAESFAINYELIQQKTDLDDLRNKLDSPENLLLECKIDSIANTHTRGSFA